MKRKVMAKDIANLLNYFERGFRNPTSISKNLSKQLDLLFDELSVIAPLKRNEEAKRIWVQFPRGTIDDFDNYEECKNNGEVETYEEFEDLWKLYYPNDPMWYELFVAEKEGMYRYISIGDKTIINVSLNDNNLEKTSDYIEEAITKLVKFLIPEVRNAVNKIKNNTYNQEVEKYLPYQFRTGVIKRSIFDNDNIMELEEWEFNRFKELINNGYNTINKISKLKDFTANDFFKACAIGYRACHYDCNDMKDEELYLKYADGRDEGLTGKGHGLNSGPGINYENSEEWNDWFFSSRGGGHPWEVCRGGNSTHVDLFVMNDFSFGEYRNNRDSFKNNKGYYFEVAGLYRPEEAIRFYISIFDYGYPILLRDSKEILARFEKTDYIGIVPHSITPIYCEHMFPKKYGRVIDFMHVYDEDIKRFKDHIEWLNEEKTEIIK